MCQISNTEIFKLEEVREDSSTKSLLHVTPLGQPERHQHSQEHDHHPEWEADGAALPLWSRTKPCMPWLPEQPCF